MDAVILSPEPTEWVRNLAQQVAEEQELEDRWLNDAAKGYIVGKVEPLELWKSPGIRLLVPSTAQLVAMRLSAWCDIQDQLDAHFLLRQLAKETGTVDAERFWDKIEPHIIPGCE